MTVAGRPAEPLSPRDQRLNFAFLVGDVTCFFIGMAFLDTSTVLPALVARLGGTPTALALITAFRQAGYYLPQLIVAHRLQGRSRYKPFLVKVCAFGRIWFFVAAMLLFLLGQRVPSVALVALGAAYCLSWIGDGMGGVPWTAIVGKIVPAKRRGHLFATTQVLSGFARLGVGATVKGILSERFVTFPASGALLILGCGVFLFLSWIFLALLREPAAEDLPSEADEPPLIAADRDFFTYLRTLPRHFGARPDIARLAVAQVLISSLYAAAPFLLGHADHFTAGGLPEDIAGTFLVVQTIGALVAAPILGRITDRYGPRLSLLILFTLSLLCAAAAVLGAILPISARMALFVFTTAFVILGAADAWSTFTNYLLEAVPDPREQTSFIALMNAASAPVLLFPLVFGGMVHTDGAATAAFTIVLFLLAIGTLFGLSLPDTRKPQNS